MLAQRGGPRARGLMLVVVLIMVALLSILAASYAFMVRANLNGVMAEHNRFQARMAAESGVQRAITILRRNTDDPDFTTDVKIWYDNPEEFEAGLVYGTEGQDTLQERREENATYDPHANPAWRFNLVATNLNEPGTLRYGLTDECARLDINTAAEAQLRLLFQTVIPEDQDHPVEIEVLVDSLLDWRESGESPRPRGAKSAYYEALDPPYRCKGAAFSTVEELLLVRDFTAWALFGEDYNGNGLLDPNEDDGDESFPPDNADGELYRGVAPFLTVWSREMNVSNDRRPRVNLNMQDTEKLREMLEEDFDSNIVGYVLDVRGAGKTFNSVMNLLPAPPPPEEEEASEEEIPATQEADAEEQSLEEATSQEDETTSQPADENAEGDDEGLSDLEQTTSAPEEETRIVRVPVYTNLTETEPPGTIEMLPLILDRLTVDALPTYAGRINVSTAPREVLSAIEELTDEDVEAIVTARRELTGLEMATPAWLLTRSVLDEGKFRMLLDGTDLLDPKPGGLLTAKSSVYRAESVGYADHLGVVERLLVVFEMRGPIVQVLYRRDLGGLGPAYMPHGIERRDSMKLSN